MRHHTSDCLLLTSLHEGSPNAVKEALACDVPVVSVDVGDVAERIQGIEGCHLARAEPEDLADKLQCVYQGSRRVSGRARMAELSIQNIARKLLEFYRDTIQS
jgi:teichuronic acid biosynthesis glycosyltransferase TuaC